MGHPKKNLHTPEPKFPLPKLTSTQEHQLQGPSKIGDDHLSEIEISIPLSVYFVCDGLIVLSSAVMDGSKKDFSFNSIRSPVCASCFMISSQTSLKRRRRFSSTSLPAYYCCHWHEVRYRLNNFQKKFWLICYLSKGKENP